MSLKDLSTIQKVIKWLDDVQHEDKMAWKLAAKYFVLRVESKLCEVNSFVVKLE